MSTMNASRAGESFVLFPAALASNGPVAGPFHALPIAFLRAWKTNGCLKAFKTKKPLI